MKLKIANFIGDHASGIAIIIVLSFFAFSIVTMTYQRKNMIKTCAEHGGKLIINPYNRVVCVKITDLKETT